MKETSNNILSYVEDEFTLGQLAEVARRMGNKSRLPKSYIAYYERKKKITCIGKIINPNTGKLIKYLFKKTDKCNVMTINPGVVITVSDRSHRIFDCYNNLPESFHRSALEVECKKRKLNLHNAVTFLCYTTKRIIVTKKSAGKDIDGYNKNAFLEFKKA